VLEDPARGKQAERLITAAGKEVADVTSGDPEQVLLLPSACHVSHPLRALRAD